jgi:HEAT repeat protein
VAIRKTIHAVCCLAVIGLVSEWASAQEKTEPNSVEEAISAAQRTRRPIFAIGGGESCPYCRSLENEMQKEVVRQELARWTVFSFDVDQSPDDAQKLAVRAIPALRLLTPAGKVVAAREGAMPAADLVTWLKENFEHATTALSPELTATSELTALQAVRLVRELGRRDSTVREAAIRRLIANPQTAAAPVAAALVDGSLATRLAAFDILGAWKAPASGLDPWQPQTITQERLEAISAWAADPASAITATSVQELSQSLQQSVAELIQQMLTAPAAEATAIRERLARHGKLLLPLVYERLTATDNDEARQRLTALRYRLVATDELALGWPGGIERLAAAEARTRHRTMDELAARATSADEPLLLELFSDPEPLVRELALRALDKAGGAKANSALVRLLDDPDPNVQAAVLKQLAEAPAPSALARLINYVEKQHDPDLLVHSVRVLRATNGKAAVECLAGLLKHENWRVRAEAAEAIGEAVGGYGIVPDEEKADAYVALVDLLQDNDPFVVSRAVQVLAKARLAIAINPLAEVAARHPALAVEVVRALADSGAAQLKVAEHLKRFARDSDAKVRASAIKGLCEVNSGELGAELLAALTDAEAPVRIAAAEGLFQLMNAEFIEKQVRQRQVESAMRSAPAVVGQALGALSSLFSRNESAKTDEAQPEEPQTAADEALTPIKFPGWMHKLREPLEKLLAGATAQERVAAALPLIALGQSSAALPVLRKTLEEDAGHVRTTAHALRWLPWGERQSLFALLIGKARGNEDISAVAYELAQRPHPSAAARLWDLLAPEDAGGSLTSQIANAVKTLYLGDRWFDLESVPKRQLDEVVVQLRQRAETGSRWQRLAAFSLLVSVDSAAASEIALQMGDDARLDPRLRASAFQIVLYASERDAAEKAAVLALKQADADRKKPALTYLAHGREALQSLEDEGVELLHNFRSEFGPSSAELPIPNPPKGITVDVLLPLVASGEARQRADAGYLLCLLGESDGLAPLIDYWKEHGRQDEELTRLVFRSIAALNDAASAPILTEIYQRLAGAENPDEHELATFYWTIRSMTGPALLSLRKRIRDEIGLENLQRNNPFGDLPGVRF